MDLQIFTRTLAATARDKWACDPRRMGTFVLLGLYHHIAIPRTQTPLNNTQPSHPRGISINEQHSPNSIATSRQSCLVLFVMRNSFIVPFVSSALSSQRGFLFLFLFSRFLTSLHAPLPTGHRRHHAPRSGHYTAPSRVHDPLLVDLRRGIS